MPIMEWTDDLSVGVPEIDRQHKAIINLVNKLHATLTDQADKELINKIFSELGWYAGEHFKHEEIFMSETNYPNLKDHKAIHESMLAQVGKVLEQCSNGNIPDIGETCEFLKKWLLNHIKVEDHKFGEHATSNGLVNS